MNSKLDQFGDSLMAEELTLSLLLKSIAKFHPEIISDLQTGIESHMQDIGMPTPGARKNMEDVHALLSSFPKPSTAH
jgi:hypothetical protein